MLTPDELRIPTLGPCSFDSPLKLSTQPNDGLGNYVSETTRIRYEVEVTASHAPAEEVLFEKAGPREKIFFDPATTRAAIVTCGGLCPGLNNVIRSIVLELHFNYRIKEILGIRYGLRGLNPTVREPALVLTPELVSDIHKEGGTILGSSRGPQDPDVIVDVLEQREVNVLFCVGGDGTQRAAHRIHEAAALRGASIAVVGVPKTIDNDILFVSRTFGFVTALEKAAEVISSAHNEAKGAPNGIGLVKVMGRDAGFIAAGASVASQDVNFCLIPEVPFPLTGNDGLLSALRQRILSRGHAVVVVAEGAGQHLIAACEEVRDASGNLKHQDIGLFLQRRIIDYFCELGIPLNLKYFDPSYLIRSVPANCEDSLLCDRLARHSVHAAMAGKTDVLMGFWNDVFVHVPIGTAVNGKKRVSPESDLWMSVLSATGQPRWREAP